jgi:hypothetical protein
VTGVKFHFGYGVSAIGYMIAIWFLSSSQGAAAVSGAPSLAASLLHIPLFAGLASCLILSVTGGRWCHGVPWPVYGVLALVAGTYAAFDAWHQSHGLEPLASVEDFLLDGVGIWGSLLIHRLTRDRGDSSGESVTLSATPGQT